MPGAAPGGGAASGGGRGPTERDHPGWFRVRSGHRHAVVADPADISVVGTVVQRQCRVEIAGRLPAGLRDELERRFGPVEVHPGARTTALTGPSLDQAGLRALLGLLWDAGVEVSAVRTAGVAPDRVVSHPVAYASRERASPPRST